jgi:hypothetical protein
VVPGVCVQTCAQPSGYPVAASLGSGLEPANQLPDSRGDSPCRGAGEYELEYGAWSRCSGRDQTCWVSFAQ